MFNVGGGELLVILLVALIVLGPSRMPEAARTVGKVVGEVRRISTGFQRELREAFEDSDDSSSSRGKESTPLASAVADLDAGDDEPDALPEADDTPAAVSSDDVRNGDGNGAAGGELAPEVEQALDQIVTPPPAEPEAS